MCGKCCVVIYSGKVKVSGAQGVRKEVTEQMKAMRGHLMREVWDMTGRSFTKEDFESLESSIVMVRIINYHSSQGNVVLGTAVLSPTTCSSPAGCSPRAYAQDQGVYQRILRIFFSNLVLCFLKCLFV
jgi:hypothetical protein